MPTSISDVSTILNNEGIPFEIVDPVDAVLATCSYGDTIVRMMIALFENGTLVQLRVPSLFVLRQGPIRPLMLRAILQMAFDTRLVQFDRDPSDDEISASVDLIVEDSKLSATQLLRASAVLAEATYWMRVRLEHIQSTGRDPVLDESEEHPEDAEIRQQLVDAIDRLGHLTPPSDPDKN